MRPGSFGSDEAYLQIPFPRPFANPRDELPAVHVSPCSPRRRASRIPAYIFERNTRMVVWCSSQQGLPTHRTAAQFASEVANEPRRRRTASDSGGTSALKRHAHSEGGATATDVRGLHTSASAAVKRPAHSANHAMAGSDRGGSFVAAALRHRHRRCNAGVAAAALRGGATSVGGEAPRERGWCSYVDRQRPALRLLLPDRDRHTSTLRAQVRCGAGRSQATTHRHHRHGHLQRCVPRESAN